MQIWPLISLLETNLDLCIGERNYARFSGGRFNFLLVLVRSESKEKSEEMPEFIAAFLLENLVTFEVAFPTSMNIPAASEMTLFFFFLHSLSLSLAFFFFRLFLFLLLACFFSSFHHKLGFWKILLSLFFVIIVVGWPSARFLSKFQFNVTFNCYETTRNFEWFWESWNNRRERLRKIPGKLD